MPLSRRTFLAATAATAATAAAAASVSTARASGTSGPSEIPSASPSAAGATNYREPERFFPRHDPIGRGRGALPGRVVWAYDPAAVHWEGEGYWWEIEHYDARVVRRMLDRAVTALAGEVLPDDPALVPEAARTARAWQTLFEARNARADGDSADSGGSADSAGRPARGYRRGEKIAIKVNMNGSGAYGADAPGFTEESYGNAVLMRALLESLVEHAGISPEDVTFYDAGRIFPNYAMRYVNDGFAPGAVFRHRDPGGALDAVPDTDFPVRWAGDIRGETSYLPRCVTEATYLINLANLKGHCYGLTLCGKNHFGSFVNTDRMRAPQAAGLHGNVAGARPGDYSVLVDLAAHAHLGGKTVLY